MAYQKDPVIKDALFSVYESMDKSYRDPLETFVVYLETLEPGSIMTSKARRKLFDCETDDVVKEILKSFLESDVAMVRDAELYEMLYFVYNEEKKRGYNPYFQIASYLISGDPSYITSSARDRILSYDRSSITEKLLKEYLK